MGISVTTLIENNVGSNSSLYNEHGLSLYIEIDEMKILFDTGQSGDFIKNAELMKVDLSKLDYVILSHGHYDHTGGFREFVNKFGSSYRLIVGNGFFNEKYKLTDEELYKHIGNSFGKEFIIQNNIHQKVICEDIFHITENVMVFSNFNKNNTCEQISKKFRVKKNGSYMLDDFSDEIVLAVKTDKGLVVICGCSHVGTVNILDTIVERTGLGIYAFIGGTHLIEADGLRVNSTIDFFAKKNVQVLGTCHCTGDKAIEEIKQALGKIFVSISTGSVTKIM